MTRTGRRERPRSGEIAPVAPAGLVGGRYNPLTSHELEQVHNTALRLLDEIGYAGATPSMIEVMTAGGCTLDGNGRLHVPRALVEDVIAKAPRQVLLASQDGRHDLLIGGGRVHLGTAGAAPLIVDFGTDLTRPSTVADVYDIARLIDAQDNIHFNWRTSVARDVDGWEAMDLNTMYALLTGSTKHAVGSYVHDGSVLQGVALIDMIAGGEKARRERPIASVACTFVVPPLRFASDSCLALEAGIRAGMPVHLVIAPQAGATGPVTLAGTVAQAAADGLIGLTFAYLLDNNCAAPISFFPFVSDLRTGAMSGGSGEQGVMAAMCAQLLRFWDLPGGVSAGMTDAKIPDAQSGAEKAHTVTLAAQAGASMVLEAAGMHASLMSVALESFVIDNDMLGSVMRGIRGAEVNEETLAFEVIRDVVYGDGHFLGQPDTLARMKTDFVYPIVGDRRPPTLWEEEGCHNVRDTARTRVREILSSHYPSHVDEALDSQIRAAFDIKLSSSAMRPGNARWPI
ncbi:MAG: trimethylamine methyltransferase family protein [Chloroflexota bacterium]